MKAMPSKECEYCGRRFTKDRQWSYKYWEGKRCCCQSHIMKILWKEKDWSKRNKKVSLSKMGSKNPAWAGDSVKYKSLHNWITKHKPKQRYCIYCKKEKWLELANISKEYKRDVNDYLWLCRKCHREYDLPDCCSNGHEYTKENTRYHGTRGHRICKKCEKRWKMNSYKNSYAYL